jgi:HSP20 family protein
MFGSLVPRSWFAGAPGSLFQELSGLHRELDSLFESAFGGRAREGRAMWWPLVEAYEEDGRYVVRCDLPGVDPKDVEVSLTGSTLTIRGERKATHEEKGTYREVQVGRFERMLSVPEGIDPEKISARYADGVLEVTLPAPVARRKVPIQIEEAEAATSRKVA